MVKDRLLVLLQILQEHTDDETALTTSELLELMEKEGQEGCKRTLRRNIASLQNCGYDICVTEANGMPTEYAYLGRKWDMPALQILVDAVSAAQFIPQNKSEELIAELSAMAGPSHVNELQPQILVSEHVKAKNTNMIFTVQEIRRAIDRNRKIRFRYLEYNLEGKQVRKHEGTNEEWYVVSPYATVWNDDRYYLVGWSDKRNHIAVYRIDRMEVPKQLPNKRVPPPDDFDVRDYTDKVFRMYGGDKTVHVELLCEGGCDARYIAALSTWIAPSRPMEGLTLESLVEARRRADEVLRAEEEARAAADAEDMAAEREERFIGELIATDEEARRLHALAFPETPSRRITDRLDHLRRWSDYLAERKAQAASEGAA